MEELLISTLQELGYPVIRQGSLPGDEAYPSHFFTFWNNSADGAGYFDNIETRTVWDFDVNFYSIDPEKTYAELMRAKTLLKEKGFIICGKGYDVASDEESHAGRGINVLYLETN